VGPESKGSEEEVSGNETGEERRVRARNDEWGTSYFYTIKRKIRPGVRVEIERNIDKYEYQRLLAIKDKNFQTIKKRRSCFFFQGQFIEVDVFDSPQSHKGMWLMEIEQTSVQKELILPPYVKVIKDVTDDEDYSNRFIASLS